MLLAFARYGVPGTLIAFGLVALVAAGGAQRYEGFSLGVGAGLALLLLNWLFRSARAATPTATRRNWRATTSRNMGTGRTSGGSSGRLCA